MIMNQFSPNAHFNSAIMLLQGIVFMLLLFNYEFSLVNIKKHKEALDEFEVLLEQENIFLKESFSATENVVFTNVSKNFGVFQKKAPLKDISFTVNRGECFGLCGIKDASRSSLLKMIIGMERATSGSIRVLGKNPFLHKDVPVIRRFVGYYTCVRLEPYFTVMDHLHYYANIKNINKNERNLHINYVVKALFLDQYVDKKLSTLNRHVQCRLHIAIALLGNPPILLLDGPSEELDPASKKVFRNLIKTLTSSGHLIILTSNDVEECEEICTRFAVISRGTCFCIGSPANLKDKYARGYNLTLLRTGNYDMNATTTRQFLQRSVPDIQCIEDSRIKIVFQFPPELLKNVLTVLEACASLDMPTHFILTNIKLSDTLAKLSMEHAVHRKEVIEEEPAEPKVKKQLIPTLFGCCAFCLCFEFFAGSDLLFEESSEDLEVNSRDDTEQSSSSSSGKNKNFCSKLCG